MTSLHQYFQFYFQDSSFVVAHVFILQKKKKIKCCECWTFPGSQVGCILFATIITNTRDLQYK